LSNRPLGKFFEGGKTAMSRLEDYEWMLHYLKTLDPINAKIIEGLGKNNPRNISLMAKNIGLPLTTVAFRTKGLLKKGFLQVRAKLDSPKLGLAKAFLIADTNHGLTDVLFKTIENVGYWTYVARCYGKFNGCYAVFSFPFKYKTALEDYFRKAKQLGAMADYVFSWITNIFEVAPNFDWFDFKRKAWDLPWEKWVREVSVTSEKLPQRLDDPKSFEIEADYTDLLILKELEKDGLRDFTQLSKVAGITPQGVRHHFHQHVAKKKLMTEYEIAIFPYPLQVSDLCAFVFDFQDKVSLAKFANSLVDKPFVKNYAKVIGRNSLLAHFYVPRVEFSNFVESLNHLIQNEIIQDFSHVSIDIPSFKRQTISYEYFQDDEWVYNDAHQVEKLIKLMPLQLKTQAASKYR
jgi:DNA-binding Lrp family transcriptional regulator